MPPLTLWKGTAVRTNDYRFIDRLVSQQYRIGGVELYIHKYIGPYAQGADADSSINLDKTDAADPAMTIQDVVNMENRDRKYDTDVYSLKGHYTLSDTEFDLRQFGLFLSNSTIFITFHLNDMVDQIGRKIMAGDVIEILNQRDDLVMGSPAAISKYYVVEDGTRPAEGYSRTWWPHLWRIKCNPMPQSSEFQDILDKPIEDASGDRVPNPNGGGDLTLDDVLGTRDDELKINDAIVAAAEAEVPFRYFQAQHFYVLPNENPNFLGQDIWTGDGIPPNGSTPVPSGKSWPATPLEGDYFLRSDYNPPQLFRRDANRWVLVQINWRNKWQPATQTLVSFINNSNTSVLTDGTSVPQQQNLRNVIKPKLDPDIV